MRIVFHVQWDEAEILRQLQQLARMGGRWLRANPGAPALYASGVIYRTEAEETFRDVKNTLINGDEDCDSLAAWRAAEVMARGVAAFEPGDPGWPAVEQLIRSGKRPRTLPAEVMLTTKAGAGERGAMYHAIARYQIGGRWYEDDPSLRLGMRDNKIDPYVVDRWRRAGVLAQIVEHWRGRGVDLDVDEPFPAAARPRSASRARPDPRPQQNKRPPAQPRQRAIAPRKRGAGRSQR